MTPEGETALGDGEAFSGEHRIDRGLRHRIKTRYGGQVFTCDFSSILANCWDSNIESKDPLPWLLIP